MSEILVILMFCAWTFFLIRLSSRREILYFEAAERCLKILVLKTWVEKRVGLLNHVQLSSQEAVLLKNTRQIHTIGMNFPIDVAFLNRRGQVLQIKSQAAPGQRNLRGPKGTVHVLELTAGTALEVWGMTIGSGVLMKKGRV